MLWEPRLFTQSSVRGCNKAFIAGKVITTSGCGALIVEHYINELYTLLEYSFSLYQELSQSPLYLSSSIAPGVHRHLKQDKIIPYPLLHFFCYTEVHTRVQTKKAILRFHSVYGISMFRCSGQKPQSPIQVLPSSPSVLTPFSNQSPLHL